MSNNDFAALFQYNYVLTAAEWQSCWAGKQDWSPILDTVIASGGVSDLAFSLDDFIVNAGTVELAGTIASAHSWTAAQDFSTLSIGGFRMILAGALTTAGAFPTTLTATGTTAITLPTSGTLVAANSGGTVTPALTFADAITLAGTGTALSVTNSATVGVDLNVGGTLGVTGLANAGTIQNAGTQVLYVGGAGAGVNGGTVTVDGIANTITASTTATTVTPVEGTTTYPIQLVNGVTSTVNIGTATHSNQKIILDIKQGTTATVLNLGTTVSYGLSIPSYIVTPSASARDRLHFFAPSASVWALDAVSQGYTV